MLLGSAAFTLLWTKNRVVSLKICFSFIQFVTLNKLRFIATNEWSVGFINKSHSEN